MVLKQVTQVWAAMALEINEARMMVKKERLCC